MLIPPPRALVSPNAQNEYELAEVREKPQFIWSPMASLHPGHPSPITPEVLRLTAARDDHNPAAAFRGSTLAF